MNTLILQNVPVDTDSNTGSTSHKRGAWGAAIPATTAHVLAHPVALMEDVLKDTALRDASSHSSSFAS